MKVSFEFDDSLLDGGLPHEGVGVLSVLHENGSISYVTGYLGNPSDVTAFGMFAYGYEVEKKDLLDGTVYGD